MKCEGCVSKVGPLLEADEHIVDWSVDLADTRKLVRAEVDTDHYAQHIIDLVNQAGFTATEVADGSGNSAEPPATSPEAGNSQFRLSNYKPLFLVLVYVVAATLFTESLHEQFLWSRAMTWFMGFFFLGFAFFKLLDVGKFADVFATYDVIGKRSRTYGLAYPWVEVSLGTTYLSQRFLSVASVGTIVLMSVGLVGVIAAVRRKQAIQCACLGTAFNLPMSAVTIFENSLMIVMAAAMLVMT